MCRNHQEEDAAMTLFKWCTIGAVACIALAVAGRAWLRVEQIRQAQDCVDVAREKGWVK